MTCGVLVTGSTASAAPGLQTSLSDHTEPCACPAGGGPGAFTQRRGYAGRCECDILAGDCHLRDHGDESVLVCLERSFIGMKRSDIQKTGNGVGPPGEGHCVGHLSPPLWPPVQSWQMSDTRRGTTGPSLYTNSSDTWIPLQAYAEFSPR